jgi:hypothetical protein
MELWNFFEAVWPERGEATSRKNVQESAFFFKKNAPDNNNKVVVVRFTVSG